MFTPGDLVSLVNWSKRPESEIYAHWGNEWVVIDQPAMPGYDIRINHIGNGIRQSPGGFSVRFDEIILTES